jgi:hypothetical protein
MRLLIAHLLLLTAYLPAQDDLTSLTRDGATLLHVTTHFGSVELETHAASTITIVHTVTVDGKPYPELARLEHRRQGSTLLVEEIGPTGDDLKELQQYPKGYSTRTEVKLIIRVPEDMDVKLETLYGGATVTDVPRLQEIESTYGTVTVSYENTALAGPLTLYSNYGAVDLALPAGTDATLELETQYGELLTDFDIALDEGRSEQRQFYEHVVGSIGGGGAQVRCNSPYGKVYLRKSGEGE